MDVRSRGGKGHRPDPRRNRLYVQLVYTVILTVTDDDGSTDTTTYDVTILDLGPNADFTWNPEPQNEGAPVMFSDLSTSYPDGIVSWDWDFGGFGSSDLQNPEFTFGDNGLFTVTLTVTDDDGSSDTIAFEVTILNVAPTVEAGNDLIGFESQELEFHGSFTDPGWLDTHEIIWDFGDGNFAYDDLHPTHSYADDGEYVVTLTVIDDDGGVGVDTLSVQVFEFVWHPPLRDSETFKSGRTIPIKFSVWQFGEFVRDESVQVTVTDSDGEVIFHAIYGEGDDHVRIDDTEGQYITNWYTDKKVTGDFTITVSFENGLSISKAIELVKK